MSEKKQLFDNPGILNEIEALRAETPDPRAIDAAVHRALTTSTERVRPHRYSAWRIAGLTGATAVLSAVFYSTIQPAHAVSLHDIAAALRSHPTRHWVDERPDANGNLAYRGEWWTDGGKYASRYVQPEDTYINGFDGTRMFAVSSHHGSYVDDVQGMSIPDESIDSYLSAPGATVIGRTPGLSEGGRTIDLYKIGFDNVTFDLYIDPATRLPVRRDVLSVGGKLTERELYDYPASLPENTFTAPNIPGIVDYPSLRSELAARLKGPGQTKEVGGVKITLKAVILGQGKVLALWTGGAKGDRSSTDQMWIENQERAPQGASARPEAFSVEPDYRGQNSPMLPLFAGSQPVNGDGAWLLEGGANRHTYIEGPFTINIPVWAEDLTRPLAGKGGYHSKVVGRLTFDITDPILADDPDRVVWKPIGGDDATTTTGVAPVNP